jgi:hypothetical protein
MFGQFLAFLREHSASVWLLLATLAFIALVCHWMAWVFGWGRFNAATPQQPRSNQLRFVIADLFTKIIDDFRHFLALIVVVIFAASLAYAMFCAGKDGEGVSKAVQGIVASLGGLVGSILGYYFGESAGARKSESASSAAPAQAVAVQATPPAAPLPNTAPGGITAVPRPPELPLK